MSTIPDQETSLRHHRYPLLLAYLEYTYTTINYISLGAESFPTHYHKRSEKRSKLTLEKIITEIFSFLNIKF